MCAGFAEAGEPHSLPVVVRRAFWQVWRRQSKGMMLDLCYSRGATEVDADVGKLCKPARANHGLRLAQPADHPSSSARAARVERSFRHAHIAALISFASI